ncbi:metallopeptidase family protein [Corynebacterium caspium]|uniref:metallopeptidase family protein n=1 Tax=Corynebacterium caspium TaxID=234828 RepID=UPI00035FECE1|nr:metallopeptidase family protein [Corynebacterium caspium]WKD59999.1 Possibl zinc metallo-peptidase [Corynebacterium caspium DSM 44850]
MSLEPLSDAAFEALIDDALDTLPDEVAAQLRNVVFLVEPYNQEIPTLLGRYEGVPLTQRTADYSGFLPDVIYIYKETLENYATTPADLAHQVYVTVMHEIGHYFGLDEDDLHRLGYH